MRPPAQLLERIEGRSHRHPPRVTENRRPDDFAGRPGGDPNGPNRGRLPGVIQPWGRSV
jgi:hypothetical protein